MAVTAPHWLDPDHVLHWLAVNNATDPGDAVEVGRVCAATELYVQRCRPEYAIDPAEPDGTAYAPDDEVYQAGVMYAARVLRRRNSPAGVESFGDVGVTFVTKYDAEIERALRVGGSQTPGVG